MGREQCFEEFRRQQRRVTGEDQYLLGSGERSPAGTDGVSGSEWAFLHRDRQATEVACRVGRCDDDERSRLEWSGRLDDPVDHPSPQDRVQVLGCRRAHAGPTASGHDDGCELGTGF